MFDLRKIFDLSKIFYLHDTLLKSKKRLYIELRKEIVEICR